MFWFYRLSFPAVWLAFFVYWRVKAADTKTTIRLESPTSRILRSAACVISLIPLWTERIPLPWLYFRLWPVGVGLFWAGALVLAGGLLFAVWAREHLGRNWSGSVTIKEGHELIVTGPYTLVRHPIYTGILTGFVGTAMVVGQVRGIVVLLVFFLAFWSKLRIEERFMRSQFGQSYTDYAHRTAALVPYLL